MGSFAFTCAFSGIPIEVGDNVRWYALTENPYSDRSVCYPHDLWFPRSWPVRAQYNDYGSICEYDVKSPSVVSIVEMLKLDLIELGTGDNTCHDIPTKIGMDFDSILDTIQERRLVVTREFEDDLTKSMKIINKTLNIQEKEIPVRRNFPQLRIVEKYITDNNFDLTDYRVDEAEHGRCRVRGAGYDNPTAKLKKLLPILKKEYAAVLTTGSGAYANQTEIQLMPKVTKNLDKEGLNWGRVNSRAKPLHVYQAMIHEEVWKEIMLMKVDSWDEKSKYSFSDFRNRAQQKWDAEKQSKLDAIMERNETEYLLAKTAVPFGMGLTEHLDAAKKKRKNFKAAQVDAFLDDVAGFSLLNSINYGIRYWWRPSFSCGPQFGEHKNHVDLFSAMKRATMQAKKLKK
mgnify:CR=1 FL=1